MVRRFKSLRLHIHDSLARRSLVKTCSFLSSYSSFEYSSLAFFPSPLSPTSNPLPRYNLFISHPLVSSPPSLPHFSSSFSPPLPLFLFSSSFSSLCLFLFFFFYFLLT